ncbi:DMT family transporter [Pararhodospirillum oryzae]|uniref:EamA domain-containing protein n=1 Tax=Pararhodospirillum oryzae TaxID=478448 RepID=A0A512H8B8_9PROT|nr:DMT family transporter [Pararhodospirillum oryzae]GEO81704.1 hypothetical protein ROR02_18350 [Pararhodospirillum oryzae]
MKALSSPKSPTSSFVPSRPERPGLGILCLVGTTLIFAGQDAITKHLVALYPVSFIVMVRYWVFAVFALGLAWAGTRGKGPGALAGALKSRRPLIQIVRALLLVSEIALMGLAFRYLGLAEVQAVFAIYPLMVMVLAIPVLGERVGWRRWAATGVAFAGLLLIVRPGLGAFQPAALYAALAAALYALFMVLSRLVSRDDGAATTQVYAAGIGALVLSLWGLGEWPVLPVADWAWLGALACLAVGAHVLLLAALTFAPASVLQPYNYLMLVWAIGVGYAVFGDVPDAWTLGGGAVIVASGLYALHRERLRARRTPAGGPPPQPVTQKEGRSA